MFPTLVRLSKASRRPLTSKKANKDYYKGTRQAYLPGGHRTGAPGKHVVRGKAKYRLIDEKVRVFIAPSIEKLNATPLKPYVAMDVKLTEKEKKEVFGKLPQGGLSGSHYYDKQLWKRFKEPTPAKAAVTTETTESQPNDFGTVLALPYNIIL